VLQHLVSTPSLLAEIQHGRYSRKGSRFECYEQIEVGKEQRIRADKRKIRGTALYFIGTIGRMEWCVAMLSKQFTRTQPCLLPTGEGQILQFATELNLPCPFTLLQPLSNCFFGSLYRPSPGETYESGDRASRIADFAKLQYRL
jgi:hypothetical protein